MRSTPRYPRSPGDDVAMTFNGSRVLVVEDDFLISLATAELLESLGCVVIGPATRLAAALRFAEIESMDAAILDINLAGELVWPVAEELLRRKVPFLYLSAYQGGDIVPAHISGVPYLEKPVNEARLQRALAAILDG
jgi:CheY-like chemotaxis protein